MRISALVKIAVLGEVAEVANKRTSAFKLGAVDDEAFDYRR